MNILRRRKLWGLPALPVVLVLLLATTALAAFLVISISGTLTVTEAISVTPESFTATLYPNETHVETFTVSNAGSVDIDVTPAVTITPAGTDITTSFLGLSQDTLTVPGSGSATFDLELVVAADADPSVSYTISVDIAR